MPINNNTNMFYHSLYKSTTALLEIVETKLSNTPQTDLPNKEKLSNIIDLIKRVQLEIKETANIT